MEIVLIRHGKPASADNPVVNAAEYTKWVRRYNLSDVATNSRPVNKAVNQKLCYAVSSDFKRAIHSAHIYTGKPPEIISELFREMEIPRYKLPLTLKAITWVYLCRVIWMFGFKGPFESYRLAKNRAELAADKLIDLARVKDNVVLFGHGYLNFYIRKALMKKGWRLKSKSNAFWGVTSLESK
ncbi:histidine phosphatase family protein [Colwellia psychrerythraea]|uniref:Phosphoglycerate mutase n=1 Tax=Colwellia psychrerythraea TaxID=28229 RepID=A0A099KV01_COLPS|nr:histidine phosphatase family protein [Colwellia psychrerythraea]KGJ93642.1 Phosphoglycerate mutase [Colwellia psychrerythraea]